APASAGVSGYIIQLPRRGGPGRRRRWTGPPASASVRGMSGTLDGLTIIEIGGIGPAPFCGMMLADPRAEVVLAHRPGAARAPRSRSRPRRAGGGPKAPEGAALTRDLARNADGLIVGFRPGVLARLGLGPDGLLADNPRLVYGRMTGWGQDGPLAPAPGHD